MQVSNEAAIHSTSVNPMRLAMNTKRLLPVMTVALLTAVLAACSSVPKHNDALGDARLAYSEASQDIRIVRHAPEELDQARDELAEAERLWRDNQDVENIQHHVYLAKQRIRIASLIAQTNETDREMEAMALERRNVTLDLREAELFKARQETRQLQQLMTALQADATERGMVLTLGDVLFDVNKSTLAPGAARKIGKVASFMRTYPEREAVIEGHTDSEGDEAYNLKLSRARATAVRDALVEAGVEDTRISTDGFGESLPVASNESEAGRQKNRRVEIIFPNSMPTQLSEYGE